MVGSDDWSRNMSKQNTTYYCLNVSREQVLEISEAWAEILDRNSYDVKKGCAGIFESPLKAAFPSHFYVKHLDNRDITTHKPECTESFSSNPT